MARFLIAIVAAVIGGALLGIGFGLFGELVPSNSLRWVYFVIFGIPAYLVASIFGEALFLVMVPSKVHEWNRVSRGTYLVFILCLTCISALVSAEKILL